jgi:hypothetical protein
MDGTDHENSLREFEAMLVDMLARVTLFADALQDGDLALASELARDLESDLLAVVKARGA